MALHDQSGTYTKYTGATIESVCANTKERLTFFLLHDDTLGSDNKEKIQQIVDGHNQRIVYCKIAPPRQWNSLRNLRVFTIGTMFRLMIPIAIPEYVDKVIYLDSDIIVDMDINYLWCNDFDNKLVLGRKELHYDNPIFEQGVNEESYINAGVMLMDLASIRKTTDFYNEAVIYLKDNPDCMWNDEDAVNYVLNNKQGIISDKYNRYTIRLRNTNYEKEQCIYHFAGDHPRLGGDEYFDKLFFDHLRNTPFGNMLRDNSLFYNCIKTLQVKYSQFIRSLKKINSSQTVAFWGAKKTSGYYEFREIVDLNGKRVFFVDKNSVFHGKVIDGYEVKSTDEIQNYPSIYVIVLAFRHYQEVRDELLKYGLREIEDFNNINALLYSDGCSKEILDQKYNFC